MKEIRINIDDFNSNKQVLIYILNLIKAGNNKFIFYSFFVTYNKIVLVNRIIDLIDKLNKNDILIKFVGFPFCVFDNHNLIEKYFINDNYYNFREAIIKNGKCLRCYYYMFCQANYNIKGVIKKPFNTELIKKNYIKNTLNEIYLFFIEIGIDKEDIFLWLQFDLNNKFSYINKELLLNVSLGINYKEGKYDRYFLYDKKQLKFLNKEINDEKFTVINNLFFKNYVIQSRFNRLISKKGLSINIGYFYNLNLKNKNYNGIKYFAQNVGFDLDTYIKQAISEKTDYKGKELKGRTNEKKQIALELIYMRIKDIKSIKEDYGKYIIGLNNSEINNYIPDIYKFNNFMIGGKNENKLTHYMIIFREINAMYIDNIDLSAVFSITNGTRLNVDYNSGIIKVLG